MIKYNKKKSITIIVSLIIIATVIIQPINSSPIKSDGKQETSRVERNYSLSNYGDGDTEYWAVTIEIMDYECDDYDLPEDGEILKRYRIYDAILAANNWKKENIKSLLNENSTKEKILDSLTWLQKNVDANDIVFFYYHGHGGMIPDNNKDEKDGMDEIICPYDIKKNENGEFINYITDDQLDEYLDNINAKGMFLVFESCQSGGLIDSDNVKIQKLKKLTYIRSYNKEFFKDIDDINRVILTSVKEQEVSVPF